MIPNAVCNAHDERLGKHTALESPRLKEAEAIGKLSQALGAKLLGFYVYAAVEGEALVFYFSHPAILMEFTRQKEVILEEMKAIWKRECFTRDTVLFRRIEAKVKAKTYPAKKVVAPYQDKASGDFDIACTDETLKKIFQRIQHTIKEGLHANK